MRRPFQKLKQFFGFIAKLFKSKSKNSIGGGAFTKDKSVMGSKKGIYKPLHQVISMSHGYPFPSRVLNQRQKRRDARRAGRKVA